MNKIRNKHFDFVERRRREDFIFRDKSYSKDKRNVSREMAIINVSGMFLAILGLILVIQFTTTQLLWQVYFGFILFPGGFFMLYTPHLIIKKQSNIVNHQGNPSVKVPFWKLDYEWSASLKLSDELELKYRKYRSMTIRITIFAFVFLFMIPRDAILIPFIIFAFVIGAILVKTINLFNAFSYHGNSFLHLEKTPILLGEKLKVKFQNKVLSKDFKMLEASLKYIQEIVKYTSDGDGGKKRNISYKLEFEKVKIFDFNDEFCLLDFNLPNDGYENNLSENEASYWVLDVNMKKQDKAFNASFLLPIYKTKL